MYYHLHNLNNQTEIYLNKGSSGQLVIVKTKILNSSNLEFSELKGAKTKVLKDNELNI